jgi:hypothetical protein
MQQSRALLTFSDGLILRSQFDTKAHAISPVVVLRHDVGTPGQREVARVRAPAVGDWWCVVDRGTGIVVWGHLAGDDYHECTQAMEHMVYEPVNRVLDWVGADPIKAAAVLRVAVGDVWPGKASVLAQHYPRACLRTRWSQAARSCISSLRW